MPKRSISTGASHGSGFSNNRSHLRKLEPPLELDHIPRTESASASGPGSSKDDGFMEEFDQIAPPATEDYVFVDEDIFPSSANNTSDFDGSRRHSALLSPVSATSSTGLCSFDVRAFCREKGRGGEPAKKTKSLTSSLQSIDRQTLQIKRRRLESLLKGFKFFQEIEPGVVAQLPNIVEFATYPRGTVIFRQGDPPGNCYIILKGELGILVKEDTDNLPEGSDDSPRSKEEQQNEEQGLDSSQNDGVDTGDTSRSEGDVEPGSPQALGTRESTDSLASLDMNSFKTQLKRLREGGGKSVKERDDGPRQQTVEGFSYYTPRSDLGQQVASLGAGNIVGELALMQDQPRSASCKCMEDMEMLVIARREFDHILKLEMQKAREEKQQFLHTHLPGIPELPAGGRLRGPHASYFFRKEHYSKGHVFFKQDEVSEECIIIVFKGAVEFQRSDHQVSPSATSAQRGRRPMSSGSMGRSSPLNNSFGGSSASRLGPSSPQRKNLSSPHRLQQGAKNGVVRDICTLLSGGVFGSMPMAGQREPFNVIAATSPCEVFCANEISRLPKKLVEAIKEYLEHALAWRLERLRRNRAVEVSQASSKPNNVSCPWGRGGLGLDLLLTGKLHPPPAGLPEERKRRPQSAPQRSNFVEPTEQQREGEHKLRLLSPVKKCLSSPAPNSRPASAPNAARLAELQRARTSRPNSAVIGRSPGALTKSASTPGGISATLCPVGATAGNAARHAMLAC